MKQYYNYSPELPKTLTFGNLNFESPLIWPGLLAYRALAHAGMKKMKAPHFSMGAFDCYCVEPENRDVLPAILYLHGGGFLFPLQSMMIQNSRYYAERLNCRVFLPEYRITPEHPFPTPFEDCLASYGYLLEQSGELQIDPNRIILMGDSAGGALAAAVCQKARDKGLPMPILQMLFYPVTDNAMTHKSMDEYAMGSWSKTANRHMWNMYLKKGDHGQLRFAAPLQSDNFADLPDSYVEVCEMDCLRDEGIAYAEKMKEAGVMVELHQVDRAYHGYDGHFESPLTQRELARRVAFMRRYLMGESV